MKKLIISVLALFLLVVLVVSFSENGEARRVRTSYTGCEDTDGWNYETQGEITLIHPTRDNRVRTDYCRDENRLLEWNCGRRYGGVIMFNRIIYCDREFGEDFVCEEGACVRENRFLYDDIMINEIMYNPIPSDYYNEWIEIYNNGDEDIDLTGLSICDVELLSGYIDRDENIHLDTTMILEPNQYAVITDGGSGTEVYDNFDVNEDSIALHVDASSLCTGLANGGDTVTIKDPEENIIDEVEYSNELGNGNGLSLEFYNNEWYESSVIGGTPGMENSCTQDEVFVVEYVIDGDTLILENEERVRLIGIDTPERGEYYYEEATDRLRGLVEGEEVILERDVENRDRYDRLLRYIYVGDLFVNMLLVEEGFARAYPFELTSRYEDEFAEAEERARENGLGIWGEEDDFIYDDFESGELNEDLWEVRRDPENQPFMEEYGVREENDNYVFHMQQNEIADRRVYLVPTHRFVEGDRFEYDSNVVSREGHYGILVIVRGNGWNRQIVGGNGYNNGVQGYDELGWGHMIIEFSDGNIITTNEAPSGEIVEWEGELPDPDGEYELYVGAFSGHNGRVHVDFDNFMINSEEE